MIIEKLAIKGDGVWNEDAMIVQEERGMFGVLDGATSFVPFRGPQGETGGYLASRVVKQWLEKLGDEQWQHLSLEAAVLMANGYLRQVMKEHQVDYMNPTQMWSTGIALIRITEQRVHYVQAGDCMLLAVYEGGGVRVLTRDQVDHLDRQTRKRWQEAVSSGSASKQQRVEQEAPFILNNKSLMNVRQGYGILNGQPELADHIEYGSFNRNQLTDLILMTDGLFPVSESYDNPIDFAAVAARILSQGLEGYAKELIALELLDPDGETFPRLKTSDDKTAIWIRLQ